MTRAGFHRADLPGPGNLLRAAPPEVSLSILTPLDAALIGLSEEQSIEYRRAGGEFNRVTVEKVLPQPSGKG